MQCHCLENKTGEVEVAAIDPLDSMQALANPRLQNIANQFQAKGKKIIASL